MKYKSIRRKYITKVYDSEHFESQPVDAYNAPITVIVGPRGIGKTFHYNKDDIIFCYENDWKMIYICETKEDVEQLSANNGERFFSRIVMELSKQNSNRAKKYLSYFTNSSLTEEVETIKDGKADYEIKKGIISLSGKQIGYLIANNDFAHLKRNNFDETYKRFIFDEFIPEKVDIRTLDNPRKIVSLIQSIARTATDVKIVMLGNSVRSNDPILSRFGLDDLEPGEIRACFDNYGLLVVAHMINRECYPNFKNKADASVAGRLATILEEDNLDKNIFRDKLDNVMILDPATKEPSKYFFTLFDAEDSIRFHKTKSGMIYCLQDYGSVRSSLYCIDKFCIDARIIYNPDLKDILLNYYSQNKILFESQQIYFKFKKILKLK